MMKCPFCNTEMIHGYLNCGMALWSDKKHKLSLALDDTERYAAWSRACPSAWERPAEKRRKKNARAVKRGRQIRRQNPGSAGL